MRQIPEERCYYCLIFITSSSIKQEVVLTWAQLLWLVLITASLMCFRVLVTLLKQDFTT